MQRNGLEDSSCVRLSVGGCVRLGQVGTGWVLAVVSGWGRSGAGGCVRLGQVDIRWDIRLTWLAVVSRESRD